MKTLVLASLLALIAVSAVLTLPGTISSVAADPVPNKPAQAAPTDIPAAPSALLPKSSTQGSSATGNLTEDGKRGQIEDLMSVCDVAPPCPSGCAADAANHKCVEWPGP